MTADTAIDVLINNGKKLIQTDLLGRIARIHIANIKVIIFDSAQFTTVGKY